MDKNWSKFVESFVYNTNAIEGNSLSRSEVRIILNDPKYYGHETDWRVKETKGLYQAINWLRNEGIKQDLTIELILKLHKITFETSKSFAGRFRSNGQEVYVGGHQGTPSQLVFNEVKNLVEVYNKQVKAGNYASLWLACLLHNEFEMIHPFEDGNGRTGRLLINYVSLKHDLPPVDVKFEDRFEYYDTLVAYEKTHDVKPATDFIIKEIKKDGYE